MPVAFLLPKKVDISQFQHNIKIYFDLLQKMENSYEYTRVYEQVSFQG